MVERQHLFLKDFLDANFFSQTIELSVKCQRACLNPTTLKDSWWAREFLKIWPQETLTASVNADFSSQYLLDIHNYIEESWNCSLLLF